MGEQKPEKTKKHICAGLLAHVSAGNHDFLCAYGSDIFLPVSRNIFAFSQR